MSQELGELIVFPLFFSKPGLEMHQVSFFMW